MKCSIRLMSALLFFSWAGSAFGQVQKTISPAKETKNKHGFLCMHDCGSASEKHYDVSNKSYAGEVIRGPRIVVADHLKSPLRYRYEWNSKTSYSTPPDLWSKLTGAASPQQPAGQPAAPQAKSPTSPKQLPGAPLREAASKPVGAKALVKKEAIGADTLDLIQKADKAIYAAQQPIEDVKQQVIGIDQNLQTGVNNDFRTVTGQTAKTTKAANEVTAAGLDLVNFLSTTDSASTLDGINRRLSTDPYSVFMQGVNAQWADSDVLVSLQSSTDQRKVFLSSKKSTFDSVHASLLAALTVSQRDLESADENLKFQSLKLKASPRSKAENDLIDSTVLDVEQVLGEVNLAKANLQNAAQTLDWAIATNSALQSAISDMGPTSDKYRAFQTAQAALAKWRDTLVNKKAVLDAYVQDKVHNPDPFSTSFSAGCDYTFSTTKQNTLKLAIIDQLPDKSADAPSDVLSLIIECASPFTVSAGVEFSTVPAREFAIQPVATPPASTTTTNEFVRTAYSAFHPLPIGMVSARLCEPNEKVSFHLSFGLSGNLNSQNNGGSSAEFLIGPSIALFRTMFITPGLHIGRENLLADGFGLGNPVPPNITIVPTQSSYRPGFGLAITFTKP